MVMATAFVAALPAQQRPPEIPVLREARPNESRITRATITGSPLPVARRAGIQPFITNSTPPTPPGDLVAETSGLFLISANWSPSVDPESGLQD
jgi:hypothetical protein